MTPVFDATGCFPPMITLRMSRLQKRNGWLPLALMGRAKKSSLRPYCARDGSGANSFLARFGSTNFNPRCAELTGNSQLWPLSLLRMEWNFCYFAPEPRQAHGRNMPNVADRALQYSYRPFLVRLG